MANATGSFRPRLNPDVFFVPLDDGQGTYCLSGGDVLTLTGASTYDWLERLAPHLDGRYRVDELTANLTRSRRQMVEALIGALDDANLVRDVGRDEPHGLTDAELAAYAGEIAFLDSFADSPGRRFERYRDTRTLVIGSGPVAVEMVRAALETGVRTATIAVPENRSIDLTGLDCAVARLDPDLDGLPALIAEFDLVLHAVDGTEPERALAVDRLCAEWRIRCVQAVILGDAAWIGPVTDPDRDEIRWEHLWRRLRPEAGSAVPTPFLTGPVPAIIATQAVFAAFEHVTGVVEPGARAGAVRLCLESLSTGSHAVPAHPLTSETTAPGEAEFLARLAVLENGAALSDDEFGERSETVEDDRVGVFGTVGERSFDQLPLRVSTATVADPVGLLGERAPLVAVAAGWDHARVRHAAARRAIELYCSLMVDRRRLIRADGRPLSASAEPSDAYTFGKALPDGSVRRVPATLVFPALAGGADDYRLPVGTASATTWSDAVDAALLDHCRALSIARAAMNGATHPIIDLASAALDRPAIHYLELLGVTQPAVTAHDVTTLPGVNAVRLDTDDGRCWYGVGLSTAEALGDALARTLLSYQVRFADVPYADPDVAAIVPAPLAADTAARRPALLGALAHGGAVPTVVPLDHDPAVHAILPYVARVVLLDD
jgi:hypothetical protein